MGASSAASGERRERERERERESEGKNPAGVVVRFEEEMGEPLLLPATLCLILVAGVVGLHLVFWFLEKRKMRGMTHSVYGKPLRGVELKQM